jgi:hypothetical protein
MREQDGELAYEHRLRPGSPIEEGSPPASARIYGLTFHRPPKASRSRVGGVRR